MAAVCLLSSSVARASNERSLPCSTVQLVSHECLLRGESGLPASRGNASSPPVSYRSSYARFPPVAEVPERLPIGRPRRNWYARCRRKPPPEWLQANRSFERLEENAGGVSKEELPISDVAQE